MPRKKRILILGAGISGLALGWSLAREGGWEVEILEREGQVGGVIAAPARGRYLFESGPRLFRSDRSASWLELIRELGLEASLTVVPRPAMRRFLWMRGALRPWCNRWTLPPLLRALCREWRVPPGGEEDESVWDFAARRFNTAVADRLFDPLLLGIYGGDARALSMRSCLPGLKEREMRAGSVTRALLHGLRRGGRSSARPFSFGLRGGVGGVVEALGRALSGSLRLGEEARRLHLSDDGVCVEGTTRTFEADLCVATQPPPLLADLLAPSLERAATLLRQIPMQRLSVVSMGFAPHAHRVPRGLGYLVPSCEGLSLLGATFDSWVLPEQSGQPGELRLTAMVRGEETGEALDALRRHLALSQEPEEVVIHRRALPQPLVGHARLLDSLRTAAAHPRLRLLGNYWEGASVDDCVRRARALASSI